MILLSLESERRIDAVCVEFETAWRNGATPDVASFLAGFTGVERDQLLHELLLIDCWHRQRTRQILTREEYRRLLPNHAVVVARAVSQHASNGEASSQATPSDRGQDECVEVPERFGRVGDYLIIEEIARGGMGVVYKARQTPLGRVVALKMMIGGRLGSGESLARFRREAKAAANLAHPNIVAVHSVGQHEQVPYFSMDYVEGGSLAGLLREGPLPPGRAAELAAAAADAVHYAHSRGVMHRDLKPSNILLSDVGAPMITDFGLAKSVAACTEHTVDEFTSTGQVLGTPSYMSPEQAAGSHESVGPASDVYSLGAVLYACLTGRPPFVSDQPLDTLLQVVRNEPVPPCMLNTAIPKDLETICLKCLEKEPQQRYATAQELSEDLRRYLSRRPVHARPIGPATKTLRWAKRNPVSAGLAALFMAALLIGTIVSCHFASIADRQAQRWRSEKIKSDQAAHRERTLRGELEQTLLEVDVLRRRSEWNAYKLQVDEMHAAYRDGDFGKLERRLEESLPVVGESDYRDWEWYYLEHEVARRSQSRKAPGGRYSFAEFDPTNRLLALRRADGDIDLCDSTNLSLRHTLQGAGQRYFAWRPGTRQLAAATDASFIDIWDADTGELLRSARAPVDATNSTARVVAWNAAGTTLALAGTHRVDLFAPDGRHVRSLVSSAARIRQIAWRPDGNKIAVVGESAVELLDSDAQSRSMLWSATDNAVTEVAWDEEGKRVASAWSRPTPHIKVQGPSGGDRVMMLADSPTTLRWAPDDETLVVAVRNHGIQFWNTSSQKLVDQRRLSQSEVRVLQLSGNGAVAATIEVDGRARRFELGSASRWSNETRLPDDSGHVTAISTANANDRIVACMTAAGATILDLSTGNVVSTLHHDGPELTSLDWHPHRNKLATLDREGVLQLWDAATGRRLEPSRHTGVASAGSVQWSPDGKMISVLSRDEHRHDGFAGIRFWDGESLEPHQALDCRAAVTAGAWSPDSTLYATHGADCDAQLRVGVVKDPLRTVAECCQVSSLVYALRFSPNGQILALAGEQGVHIVDSESGQIVARAPQLGLVKDLQWSPDGTRILCSLGTTGLSLLDAKSASVLLSLDERDGVGMHSCWAAGGRQIVTATTEGSLRTLDAPNLPSAIEARRVPRPPRHDQVGAVKELVSE